jgi:hypothetical protein
MKKEKMYKTSREIISKYGRFEDECKDWMFTLNYMLRE